MDQQDYFYGEVKHNYWKGNLKLFLLYTGYYLSETLILSSINPKYDDRLFVELHVQYKKTTSSKYAMHIKLPNL